MGFFGTEEGEKIIKAGFSATDIIDYIEKVCSGERSSLDPYASDYNQIQLLGRKFVFSTDCFVFFNPYTIFGNLEVVWLNLCKFRSGLEGNQA